MADEILAEITQQIKKAKYFSISVGSTPDEGHIDQLTVVLRYIEKENPIERFLTFLPNCGHTGAEMVRAIKLFLCEQDIDLNNCRGQSYDNAANMSGKGMKTLIQNENSHAIFVSCCAHSLNLVGKSAVNTCSQAVKFFSFVQALFVFFTSTPLRYKILINKLSNLNTTKNFWVLKNLNDTRWSCRADPTKAVAHGYNHILDALTEISENNEEKSIVRNEAQGLLQTMSRLETAIYTQFWHEILERFDETSKMSQSSQINLNTVVNLLKSLKLFVESKRNEFETYETAGKKLSNTQDYESVRGRTLNVRLQPLDYGKAVIAELTPREKFRIEAFIQVIDQLIISLDERLLGYKIISDKFSFLADLSSNKPENLKQRSKNLVNSYPEDLESALENELIQFSAFIKNFEKNNDESEELFQYRNIVENNVQEVS